MASHGQGESVCLPACPPLLPLLPPPLFHLPSQPVSATRHLVRVSEQPRLCGFKKVSFVCAGVCGCVCVCVCGGGGYVCTCKSFANMKSSENAPHWICSAWGVLPIPRLNRQMCSMAKWPPVCQKSHPTHRPGARDKCLHFWLSPLSQGKELVIYLSHFNLKLQTSPKTEGGGIIKICCRGV